MLSATSPTPEITLTNFEKDMLEGLSSSPKKLSSKYFYNNEGSKLFQQIMHLPEYYLTRSEFEILESYKGNLLQNFTEQVSSFDLVELGAGDGLKTEVLLKHFVQSNQDFTYSPIDISAQALEQLRNRFAKNIPELDFKGIEGDYFKALQKVETNTGRRKVVLFLGSNIGNFDKEGSLRFLKELRQALESNDMLLLGFDLKKHPKIVQAAYDDAQGITKAFNLNLLKRINSEMEANFDISKFDFYSTYILETGEVRSYIVSNAKQDVYLKSIDEMIHFGWGETIHTEISRKHNAKEMEAIANQAGFELVTSYTDCKGYFMDALFVVK